MFIAYELFSFHGNKVSQKRHELVEKIPCDVEAGFRLTNVVKSFQGEILEYPY